jgi:hypothetical protein
MLWLPTGQPWTDTSGPCQRAPLAWGGFSSVILLLAVVRSDLIPPDVVLHWLAWAASAWHGTSFLHLGSVPQHNAGKIPTLEECHSKALVPLDGWDGGAHSSSAVWVV